MAWRLCVCAEASAASSPSWSRYLYCKCLIESDWILTISGFPFVPVYMSGVIKEEVPVIWQIIGRHHPPMPKRRFSFYREIYIYLYFWLLFCARKQVVHGKAEEIDLPKGAKVDVIVSEWMGFYLLHESMLESVLLARDKHLKPDGVMLPSKATLYAAACRLGQFYSEQVDFWKDLYGLDLSPVGQAVLDSKRCKPEVAVVKADELLSAPVQVADFDLAWLGPDEIERVHSRAFTSVVCDEPTEYQGVCLWFDCSFEWPDRMASSPVKLSTSPSSAATHWKQTIIVLPSSIQVEEGDLIGWELTLNRSPEHRRRYQIELNLLDPEEDEHPVPCSCGQARCVVIAAFMAKADQEPLPDDGVDVFSI